MNIFWLFVIAVAWNRFLAMTTRHWLIHLLMAILLVLQLAVMVHQWYRRVKDNEEVDLMLMDAEDSFDEIVPDLTLAEHLQKKPSTRKMNADQLLDHAMDQTKNPGRRYDR